MISFNFSSTNVYHFRSLHFSEHKLYTAHFILPSYKSYSIFVYYGIYTIHISIHSYFTLPFIWFFPQVLRNLHTCKLIINNVIVGLWIGGGEDVCPKSEFQIQSFHILRKRPCSCRYIHLTYLFVVCRHFTYSYAGSFKAMLLVGILPQMDWSFSWFYSFTICR